MSFEEDAFVRGFNRGLRRGIIEGKKVVVKEFLADLKKIKKYPKDKTRLTLILKKWEKRRK